jgi:hypothetical protein
MQFGELWKNPIAQSNDARRKLEIQTEKDRLNVSQRRRVMPARD